MPIYMFECEKCKDFTEKICSVKNKPEKIECVICGGDMRSIMGSPADRQADWSPYWDENLGDNPVFVESREHRRELMKKAGLRDQYHHKPGMPGQWI